MTSLASLVLGWLPGIALAVLQAALRWTPVLAVAAVLALLARRGSPGRRHLAWAGALVAAGVVLSGAPLLPRWELPLGTGEWWSRLTAAGVRLGESVPWVAGGGTIDPRLETVPLLAPLAATPAMQLAPAPHQALTWVAVAWLLGASLLLARELTLAWRLDRAARRAPEARWPALDRLRRRHPRLRALACRVAPVPVPLVVGVLRPRVLLPPAARRWPRAWLAAALLHEAAHVERRDLAWLLAARLVRALLWLHPGSWLLVRRLAAEAEACCDERAVADGIDRLGYARALVRIAGAVRAAAVRGAAGAPLAAGLAVVGPPSALRRRLQRLLTATAPASRGGSVWVLVALVACGAVAASARLVPGVHDETRVVPLTAAWPTLERVGGGDAWRARCPPSDAACAANTAAALRLLRAHPRGGLALAQRVDDGRLVAYVAIGVGRGPSPGVPALAPGSLAKLPLAAAWWESGLGEPALACAPEVAGAPGLRLPVPDELRDRALDTTGTLVHSCTSAAVELAAELASRRGPRELPAALAPLLASDALAAAGPDRVRFLATQGVDWRLQAAGVGPLTTTPFAVARYLHATASGGRGVAPWSPVAGGRPAAPVRLFSATTGERLRGALRATVRHGTARAAAAAGADAGWALAGKTGTVAAADGSLDGWFAGLVERDGGAAELVVVVWLRGDGPGGGPPTRLAAALAGELAR